ncbi:hypothetical protein NX059_010416 [Plenodomus lindquistii]|nr:hypothetical protein NX059_010416 [Plenodomus lindquistii]
MSSTNSVDSPTGMVQISASKMKEHQDMYRGQIAALYDAIPEVEWPVVVAAPPERRLQTRKVLYPGRVLISHAPSEVWAHLWRSARGTECDYWSADVEVPPEELADRICQPWCHLICGTKTGPAEEKDAITLVVKFAMLHHGFFDNMVGQRTYRIESIISNIKKNIKIRQRRPPLPTGLRAEAATLQVNDGNFRPQSVDSEAESSGDEITEEQHFHPMGSITRDVRDGSQSITKKTNHEDYSVYIKMLDDCHPHIPQARVENCMQDHDTYYPGKVFIGRLIDFTVLDRGYTEVWAKVGRQKTGGKLQLRCSDGTTPGLASIDLEGCIHLDGPFDLLEPESNVAEMSRRELWSDNISVYVRIALIKAEYNYASDFFAKASVSQSQLNRTIAANARAKAARGLPFQGPMSGASGTPLPSERSLGKRPVRSSSSSTNDELNRGSFIRERGLYKSHTGLAISQKRTSKFDCGEDAYEASSSSAMPRSSNSTTTPCKRRRVVSSMTAPFGKSSFQVSQSAPTRTTAQATLPSPRPTADRETDSPAEAQVLAAEAADAVVRFDANQDQLRKMKGVYRIWETLNQRLERELDREQTKIRALENETLTLEDEERTLKEKHQTLEGKNRALQDGNYKLEERNQTLRAERRLLEDEERALQEEERTLQNQNHTLRESKQTLVTKNGLLGKQKHKLTKKNRTLNNRTSSVHSQAAATLSRENLDLKTENTKLRNENTNLKNENSNKKNKNTKLETHNTAMKTENISLTAFRHRAQPALLKNLMRHEEFTNDECTPAEAREIAKRRYVEEFGVEILDL